MLLGHRFRIDEPDVTLTDFGLAIENALFAYKLSREQGGQTQLRESFVLLFGSAGVASLAGGLTHGYFGDKSSVGYRVFWPATLLALGTAALASWSAGAGLALAPEVQRRVRRAAQLEYASYCVLVLLGERRFGVALANYLPPTLFLGLVFARHHMRTRERHALWGLLGIGLAFVAAGVQAHKVALHRRYFNHNALYHAIQAVALYLCFQGARWLVGQDETSFGRMQG